MSHNLRLLFSSPYRTLAYLVLVVLGAVVWWQYTNIRIMFGNYGNVHTSLDIAFSVMIILGFPLFLIALYYKSLKFGWTKNLGAKTGGGLIGGIIGTIISGASCCGATLAASFWLLPLMTLLPFSGLEIKALGVAGLLYALYDIIKNLENCKYTPKKVQK